MVVAVGSFLIETILLDIAANTAGSVITKSREQAFCSHYEPLEMVIRQEGKDFKSAWLERVEYVPPDTRQRGAKASVPQSITTVFFKPETTTGKNKNIEGKEPMIFFGIPYQLIIAMMNATSKGRFFYKNLVNHYPSGKPKEVQDIWKRLFTEGKIYGCIFNYYNKVLEQIKTTALNIVSKKTLERTLAFNFLNKINTKFGLGLTYEEANTIIRFMVSPTGSIVSPNVWRSVIDDVLKRKQKNLNQAILDSKAGAKARLFENPEFRSFGRKFGGAKGEFGEGLAFNAAGRKAYAKEAKAIEAAMGSKVKRIKTARGFIKATRNPFLNIRSVKDFDMLMQKKIEQYARTAVYKGMSEQKLANVKGSRAALKKSKSIKNSVGKIVKKIPK